jgi:hypothetical protein
VKSVIFDVDGTLLDNSHRQHHLQKTPKDWDAFNAEMANDTPKRDIIAVAQLFYLAGYHLIICTGRQENARLITETSLREAGCPAPITMYMRADGDFRDDAIIKSKMLDQIHRDGFNPRIVVDDRQKVVDMFRSRGLTVLQCAEGDF